MRQLVLVPALLLMLLSPGVGHAAAAAPVVRDGDTIQIDGTTWRLDGIDAPEFDQTCIDDHADPWTCGIEARDRVVELIGKRTVRCDDLGPAPGYKKWKIGLCHIDGETASLNELIVRAGYAVQGGSAIKAKVADAEADARAQRRGIWRGCFVAPQDFRKHLVTAPLLGASCPADKDSALRAVLFPDEPVMPPSCPIKARLALRARITGNVGVYQLRGCPSYASLTKPNRWFCSEDDARAAGFRRAYNCRP